MDKSGPVLLFDGECGLCVRCVKFLLWFDRKRRLRFAPLQGAAAQAFLRERGLPEADFDSAIFVADWSRRRTGAEPAFKTDALLAALVALGGLWRVAAVFRFVLRDGRDGLYAWVARRRRKIFGPAKPGDLPAAEVGRFLP